MSEYNSHRPPMTTVQVAAKNLRVGDRFFPPGMPEVRVLHDYGSFDRPMSVAVRQVRMYAGDVGFFLSIDPDRLVWLTATLGEK